MQAIRLNIIALFAIAIFSSCTNKPREVWYKASIDSTISKNEIFKILDKQLDNRGPLPNDTPGIKTSDVSYRNNRNHNINDSTYAKLNNCKVYLLNTDTLMIKIGLSNLFTGSGFIISYTNQQFNIEPYYSTDVLYEKRRSYF